MACPIMCFCNPLWEYKFPHSGQSEPDEDFDAFAVFGAGDFGEANTGVMIGMGEGWGLDLLLDCNGDACGVF
jgi:hypothetical protein